MSILDLLAGQLGGDKISQISRQLGTDEKATGTAVSGALATILGALAKNSQSEDGAKALHQALNKDHDGGILNNLNNHMSNPQAANGDGILAHILGGRRQVVEKGLGQTAGLKSDQMGKLMSMLAPVVMGALGQTQKQKGFSASDLGAMLGQERKQIETREPAAKSLLGSLLDTDGDGDVDMMDAVKHGKGLLGKLFNR